MAWLVIALVWISVAAALGILIGTSIRVQRGREAGPPVVRPALEERPVGPNVALPAPRRAFDPDVAPGADVSRSA